MAKYAHDFDDLDEAMKPQDLVDTALLPPIEQPKGIAAYTDAELAEELRRRGYSLTAEKITKVTL